MGESILDEVKDVVGIPLESKSYDNDLILAINTQLFALTQLGIGGRGFHIQDGSEKWSDFEPQFSDYMSLKSYIHLKVRLMFDPPSNNSIIEAIERQLAEIEWRLVTQKDSDDKEEKNEK